MLCLLSKAKTISHQLIGIIVLLNTIEKHMNLTVLVIERNHFGMIGKMLKLCAIFIPDL